MMQRYRKSFTDLMSTQRTKTNTLVEDPEWVQVDQVKAAKAVAQVQETAERYVERRNLMDSKP